MTAPADVIVVLYPHTQCVSSMEGAIILFPSGNRLCTLWPMIGTSYHNPLLTMSCSALFNCTRSRSACTQWRPLLCGIWRRTCICSLLMMRHEAGCCPKERSPLCGFTGKPLQVLMLVRGRAKATRIVGLILGSAQESKVRVRVACFVPVCGIRVDQMVRVLIWLYSA